MQVLLAARRKLRSNKHLRIGSGGFRRRRRAGANGPLANGPATAPTRRHWPILIESIRTDPSVRDGDFDKLRV
jgi:hypothetical protein